MIKTYKSVDKLQNALASNVFKYTKDPKKASGRALGTIVEIISFYLLKSWGLNNCISIETRVPEYGNPDITHNVEYSLHPILKELELKILNDNNTIASGRILEELKKNINIDAFNKKGNNLLTKNGILRNACTVATTDSAKIVASIKSIGKKYILISVIIQSSKPYAIFECKRVGIEEGNKKGPQTIEKAKQGAYVAKTVSSLQKARLRNGNLVGIIDRGKGGFDVKPYLEMLSAIINSDKTELLQDFILTVGVVSNHGNWFTAQDHNKELKVLAQSYDWLIFLTDEGIIEFINKLILKPAKSYKDIQTAFYLSYEKDKKKNQFTKVNMNINADAALLSYFIKNQSGIDKWFNIISPASKTMANLKEDLKKLEQKDWEKIL